MNVLLFQGLREGHYENSAIHLVISSGGLGTHECCSRRLRCCEIGGSASSVALRRVANVQRWQKSVRLQSCANAVDRQTAR